MDMLTSIPEKSSSRRMFWLLVELVVVFLGVYSAFLLESYKEERNNDIKRQQFYTYLEKYLTTASKSMAQGIPLWDEKLFLPFIEPYEKGEMPALYNIHFNDSHSVALWESILTKSFNLLDFEFFIQMHIFLDSLRRMQKNIQKFNRLNEAVLVPNMDKGKEEFYDVNSTRLKKKYEWYIIQMQILRQEFKSVHSHMDKIVSRLQETKVNKK